MKMFKKVILVLVFFSLSIGLVAIGNGYDMYKTALEQESLQEKINSIREKENFAKIQDVPQMYLNAVISVEDHRFYQHKGIDLIAICRAIINDAKAFKLVEGGSTITQQLAKNIYFTQEKKFTRKIAEIFMAFNIEHNYSKDEILELYVNTCYFGDGYYTVKEACNGYFYKDLKEMTSYEMILLAGIPNAPTIYAPTKNPELAKQRQMQVIDKMIKYNYLTKEQAQKILN